MRSSHNVAFAFHDPRLADERERACDEEVLRMGSDPEVYAQGILKVCKFYLESPLVCVAGVTGSNLKKRIEEIMMHRIVHQLELRRKLLLAVAGTAAIALPVAFGVLHALPQSHAELQAQKPDTTSPIFEVASIKHVKSNRDIERIEFTPDGFTAATVTLRDLIRKAYGVEDNMIVGGPGWLNSTRYDIEAKVDASALEELRNLVQRNASLTTNACFKRSWRIASGLPFTTGPRTFRYMCW